MRPTQQEYVAWSANWPTGPLRWCEPIISALSPFAVKSVQAFLNESVAKTKLELPGSSGFPNRGRDERGDLVPRGRSPRRDRHKGWRAPSSVGTSSETVGWIGIVRFSMV